MTSPQPSVDPEPTSDFELLANNLIHIFRKIFQYKFIVFSVPVITFAFWFGWVRLNTTGLAPTYLKQVCVNLPWTEFSTSLSPKETAAINWGRTQFLKEAMHKETLEALALALGQPANNYRHLGRQLRASGFSGGGPDTPQVQGATLELRPDASDRSAELINQWVSITIALVKKNQKFHQSNRINSKETYLKSLTSELIQTIATLDNLPAEKQFAAILLNNQSEGFEFLPPTASETPTPNSKKSIALTLKAQTLLKDSSVSSAREVLTQKKQGLLLALSCLHLNKLPIGLPWIRNNLEPLLKQRNELRAKLEATPESSANSSARIKADAAERAYKTVVKDTIQIINKELTAVGNLEQYVLTDEIRLKALHNRAKLQNKYDASAGLEVLRLHEKRNALIKQVAEFQAELSLERFDLRNHLNYSVLEDPVSAPNPPRPLLYRFSSGLFFTFTSFVFTLLLVLLVDYARTHKN